MIQSGRVPTISPVNAAPKARITPSNQNQQMTQVTTLRATDMKPINPNSSGPGCISGCARKARESRSWVWWVTEYEYQTTRAQSEAQASNAPDTKAARRHSIDSARGRFARQLAGKSDRNGP